MEFGGHAVLSALVSFVAIVPVKNSRVRQSF